jgi:hypothetical protein
MPILESIAGASVKGYGGFLTRPILNGVYESIQSVYLSGGNSAEINFTSIPATFKHLEIRYSAASDRTNNFLDDVNIRFGNGSIDTGANYNYRASGLEGIGGGAFTTDQTGVTQMQSGLCVGGSTNTNYRNGIGVFYIPDYANTSKNKTLHGSMAFSTNSGAETNRFGMFTGGWNSSAAITHIRLTLANSNWLQYSRISLYGIKGAA